ncbi:MAG: sodium/solute symporter [Candidatus Marinimicrobia bacterium]|jgi:SSS family transporter|nr:sodium/solute symporter [Candidatus Neomarinimicrobiota bacterium]MBT3948340.1 sodium/solute symporter [Candidatus Neomarinimicrobiota bacterium]MBT4065346.1 sodium/solute symporter [Candidatus Neomarinimicrobiota bacterium]MBT4306909.1 sodium/solute symporter [Candidatus Neomarinimicrobiota bacterium]MBT4453927.1 sodium/solute symporter [Candidatus Neomarinimicrobiota bacterium]
MALGGIDYFIIIVYLIGTVLFGMYIGRKMKSGDDYFLAGRSLPWWAIGMSLVVTDIGAVDMVGIAGAAYLYGIVLGNYDWLGSVPVMIVGAFLFIPMFWKSKVSTIPEWLGARYNQSVRTISAVIWGIVTAFGLGVTLYATALMFNLLLDLNPKVVVVTESQPVREKVVDATGAGKSHDFIFLSDYSQIQQVIDDKDPNLVLIDQDWSGALSSESAIISFDENEITSDWGEAMMHKARPPTWTLMYSIIIMSVLIGTYTLFGGLKAVVYTDVLQCIVMLGGSLFVLFFGIYRLGGISEFVSIIQSLGPRAQDHFELILSVDTATPHPWSGIFLGLGLVLANAYWFGNQNMVQRTLGAKSEADAKASYVFGSFLKILIPFAMVIPGIIALAHDPNITDADKAMAILVKDILPTGILGLFFAAFLAGLMSSVDSALNSGATIWTKDVYQKFFKPNATPADLLIIGRWITGAMLAIAIFFAQFATRFESIYDLSQTILSLFQGPSLAIIAIGMLWKRATGKAALVSLLSGVAFAGMLMWVNNNASVPLFQVSEPFLYVAWWSFVLSVVILIVVSLNTPPEPESKLKGLVYRYE